MKSMLEILGDHACVVLRNNDVVFSSDERGVKPLLDYYNLYGVSFAPLTVIDKVVGRGAVLLAKRIGAEKIMTPTMSEDALSLAKYYEMDTEVLEVVPYIVNRQGDGRCPIESSVLGITDVEEGVERILAALASLRK